MQLIESKTLGSAQASIEFTNIPQTFTDLLIVASLRASGTLAYVDGRITFNSNTSNYSYRNLYGSGSGGGSSNSGTTASHFFLESVGRTADPVFASIQIYIPNYTASVAKSWSADSVEENNGTSSFAGFHAGLWNNTSAISTIKLEDSNGFNLVQYSMASLYGITKGSDGTTTVS